MSRVRPFNLFVYGTLMSPSVFRAVLGKRMVFVSSEADNVESFYARDAVLSNYKKITPDGTYLYAVPDPQGRIRGYVLGPLPGECMAALRQYEGRNYTKRTVEVQTREGSVGAVLFVANLKQLEHSFGYAFRDPLKQEILLEAKIEAALVETERQQIHSEDKLSRRALGELHGSKIRDLIRHHFEAGGISDYAIKRTLLDDPLRDYGRIVTEPRAQALANNYLSMVVRQVLFNQIEEMVHRDFRYELDHLSPGELFYERTISSVLALRLLNTQPRLLDVLVGDCLTDLDFSQDHLVDFVRWGVLAADAIYEPRQVKRELELVRSHMGRGYIPMGVELEFSNIGHEVIRDPDARQKCDPQYDGFVYFYDFGLDTLTWKLGGHVDDHRDKAVARPRRGFFELALGNLSIEANLSKPITDDPWLLNQFIHEARRFYEIRPHSLHLSMQMKSQHQPARDNLVPLYVLKCLFALAGDPGMEAGRLVIRRLSTEEIIRCERSVHMLFSDISKRHSASEDALLVDDRRDQQGRFVQQFKFLRLSASMNYEPIAMALKGIQINLRPGTFMTARQYQTSPRHRQLFEELLEWGVRPTELSQNEIENFLSTVHEGLMVERRGRPAHSGAYISWSLSELRKALGAFNRLVRTAAAGAAAQVS
ncbi:MAG: AIG2-like family protein [Planctomycetes bacterium ADurb.Bin126]|nr:MAG: AIG2-like family protein [Planctomycetes bacterium ADurb.Bin126]HOD80660.1 gamma-glutamylcyclotransferase [Phycisphaerae bacterium]HQL73894.1 gamma-glutamylcyclotransferase [Phycisphaerae bacterium]